jgi:hypothetical protein
MALSNPHLDRAVPFRKETAEKGIKRRKLSQLGNESFFPWLKTHHEAYSRAVAENRGWNVAWARCFLSSCDSKQGWREPCL